MLGHAFYHHNRIIYHNADCEDDGDNNVCDPDADPDPACGYDPCIDDDDTASVTINRAVTTAAVPRKIFVERPKRGIRSL